MIVYDKLHAKMAEKGISFYKLEKYYKISTNTLRKLKKNQQVTTYTLNRLCYILDCDISDIAEFRKDDDEKIDFIYKLP